jgi:hypothetical protein
VIEIDAASASPPHSASTKLDTPRSTTRTATLSHGKAGPVTSQCWRLPAVSETLTECKPCKTTPSPAHLCEPG